MPKSEPPTWNQNPREMPIDKLVVCGSREIGLDIACRLKDIPDKVSMGSECFDLDRIEFWFEIPEMPS